MRTGSRVTNAVALRPQTGPHKFASSARNGLGDLTAENQAPAQIAPDNVPDSGQNAPKPATVAALYVEENGVYFGLPDVDPWDEARDARRYAGPWPVVAHPPCQRWCQLAPLNQSIHGYKIGDDGGCFLSALTAVRTWGGVLEHPAETIAWPTFSLPRPPRRGWALDIFGGCSTEIEQGKYGHPARKRTWLYCAGVVPDPLTWGRAVPTATVSCLTNHGGGDLPRLSSAEAKKTPLPFRDLLLSIARTASPAKETP